MSQRERPPSHRKSETIKVSTQGRTFFITVGRYPDGRPCEVFIDTSKSGSDFRAIMHSLAMMVSLGMQYGCPVEEIIDGLNNFNPHEIPRQIAKAIAELCLPEKENAA